MILDDLSNWRQYLSISSRFQAAFDFLQRVNEDVPLGWVEIDGDDVYALVLKYTTQPSENPQFEVHRRYIDVQYIHRGRETIF